MADDDELEDNGFDYSDYFDDEDDSSNDDDTRGDTEGANNEDGIAAEDDEENDLEDPLEAELAQLVGRARARRMT